jgi:hypothetical protein
MSKLLYVPSIQPSDGVLHRSILYHDSLSTLTPSNYGDHISDGFRQALDAGLYKPMKVTQLWENEQTRAEVFELTCLGSIPFDRQGSHDITTILDFARVNLPGFDDPAHPDFTTVLTYEIMANILPVDKGVWSSVLKDAFNELLTQRVTRQRERFIPNIFDDPLWQLRFLACTAYIVAGQTRRDSRSSLVVPCYPAILNTLVADCATADGSDHLLARVDVGNFLPTPPPGIDTATVIAFRERYDDERRRLIAAVERLVKESARSHGPRQGADIERDVHQELKMALADMQKAGRSVFGGWIKRAAWFGVAMAAGSIFGPAGAAVGAAVGSVAANWASNAVPPGRSSGVHAELTYLYRLHGQLADFQLRTDT